MTKFRKIGLFCLALAVCVAVGRVLALVHSPLDVVGGAFCGVAGAAVWYYLYHRDTPKKLPRDLKEFWQRVKELSIAIGGDVKGLIRKVRK
jgi:membrane-associated phospholipid phosphatase